MQSYQGMSHQNNLSVLQVLSTIVIQPSKQQRFNLSELQASNTAMQSQSLASIKLRNLNCGQCFKCSKLLEVDCY